MDELTALIEKAHRMIDGMTFATSTVTHAWLLLAMKRIRMLSYDHHEICQLIMLRFNVENESYYVGEV